MRQRQIGAWTGLQHCFCLLVLRSESPCMCDPRMDDLGDFLRQRKIPEETTETMLKEKIDTNVIQLMTDEELKSYLPSYGDRLALLGYCKRRENGTPNSRKSKLFEHLKSKLGKRTADEDGRSTEQEEKSETTVKKNALKSKRKIEIGWMAYDEEKQAFKQIRAKRGGGTRRVDVLKDAKKRDNPNGSCSILSKWKK
ncbi:hypothetical protein ATANTOWER_022658 [Ataeniobius toweri]|uniref:Uncharacterized protein n=1 Tax=Ataeniobius toweri TaxID=208326 RepID=A0ABU7B9U8_9TELE|nr:hypothetical protein [Ataeniobius toweri]